MNAHVAVKQGFCLAPREPGENAAGNGCNEEMPWLESSL